MILIWFALLLTMVQYSLGHNTILSSLSHNLSSANVLAGPSKQVFMPVKYTVAPELKPRATPFTAQASSAVIYDVSSARTLYEKNAHEARPIASLTKLMTALVILQNHSPDEIVTIPDGLPPLAAADQKIGVQPGEQFKLSELVQALLIYSANDVANSLAIWDSGSVEKFATKMNSYGQTWGLSDSHFVNPSGLDAEGHQSSAADLLVLANILLHNTAFKKTINTQAATIRNVAGKPYALTTTNYDLSLPYVYGIKTGLTDLAGQCLILLAQRNGHEIITVVLNSPDRFQESKNMVDYTFANYTWK